MEKFTSHAGKVITLPIRNVDTDMIIPAQFLTNITKEGYASALFQRLREQDPEFPFNLEKFKGASILVSDSNFGCGSSREHAVWALLAGGIRVVIAKSFADIFFNNSAKNGLLLVTLRDHEVDNLLDRGRDGNLRLTVDLAEQTVKGKAGMKYSFEFDGFRRYCLLEGKDELDYILAQREKIEAWSRDAAAGTFIQGVQPEERG